MMKRSLLLLLLSISLPFSSDASTAQIPVTNQSSCYTSTGATVDCGGTVQDGDSRAGSPWPAPRFTDNRNGTVTDSLTDLIWLQNAGCIDPRPWSGALSDANALADGQCSLSDGSHSGDWRLPNVSELESLIDVSVDTSDYLPALTSRGIFSNTRNDDWYWTSTSAEGSPENAWQVGLTGSIGFGAKGTLNYVWPVRGGSGGATQLPVTAQTGCFNAVGGSISCSGTGQDGEKLAGAPWPFPRFTNADGTVPIAGTMITDQLTGLIWTRDGNAPGPDACLPRATKDWQASLDYVKCLNNSQYLGHDDWRLPNRKELLSRLNRGQGDTSGWLNDPVQGFTNAKSDIYWSSSTIIGFNDSAWPLFLSGGYAFGELKSGEQRDHWAWPVRGGLFGNSSMSVSPASREFGSVGIGSSSTQEIIISNAAAGGASPLALNAIVISGTNGGQYSVNVHGGSNPCGSYTPVIPAGSSCTISVTFTPASSGAKSAALRISGSDADLPNASIPLSGSGGSDVSPSTIVVNPSAGPYGTLTPATAQSYPRNSTPAFTVTPAANYHATVTGCGGTLSGTSYSIPALTADCTVSATFAINTYTVTPSVGANGSMEPNTPRTVNYGSTASFALLPNTNYHPSVTGSCGGILSGNTFTTGPITANCTVSAEFPVNTNTVTLVFHGGTGSTNPAMPQTLGYGSAVQFTITPAVDYHIMNVTGCGGTRSGNTYTTGSVTGNCQIDVTLEKNTSFAVSFAAGLHGSLTGTVSQVVNANGSTTEVRAVPAYGYHFVSWEGPGGFTSTSASLTVSNVNATMLFTAIFAPNPVTVRIVGSATPYFAIDSTLDSITTPNKTLLARAEIFVEEVSMTTPVSILLRGGYSDGTFSTRTATSATVIVGSLKIRSGTLRTERLVVR